MTLLLLTLAPHSTLDAVLLLLSLALHSYHTLYTITAHTELPVLAEGSSGGTRSGD